MRQGRHDGRHTNGALADAIVGAAAGAAAVWVMDRIDWFNYRYEDDAARRQTQSVRPGGMDPAHVAAQQAAGALGYRLEPREHNAAGLVVHYAIGALPAAVYGALRRSIPAITAGHGTAFGLGLFFVQDEGLNALAGLSARPNEYPWQAHARGLVAHAVYGLVLETALEIADGLRDAGGDAPGRLPPAPRARSADEHPHPRSRLPAAQ